MEICGGLSCGYPFLAGLTDVGGCLLSLTGQFLHVFDRLGRCFSLLDSGLSPGFIFCTGGQDFIDSLYGFSFGLACRPADSSIALFVARFLEGRQSWLGGLVSLAWWLGRLRCVCFLVLSNCESATLLVTRLGLMPCSAWSKKNCLH